ncbi:MAG: TolC family protein [Deltaproteobacteria bacterium]|nr:TolC family protein [Deltaproteobacteria bacterium]
MPDAIRYALEHSPTVEQAMRHASIADLQSRNSRATFLPGLDLSATNGLKRSVTSGQPVTPHNPWLSDVNAALTETLYDNGSAITKYKIASLTNEIARINFEGARAQLTLDVSVSYYKYSLAQKIFEVAEQRSKILGKQFASVSSQYRQGMKTRQDFLRFKTQVQRSDLDHLASENEIRVGIGELKRLLGFAVDSKETPEFVAVEPAPFNPKTGVPQATPPIDKVYGYRANILQRRANELNVDFTRRLYLPQLAVTAGSTYDNSGYIGNGTAFSATNTLSWTGQLVLTYNIWDWGTRARNVEIAEHARVVQDEDLVKADLALRQNIENLMLQLRLLQESYKLNVELLELSQQSYDFLEEEYRRGHITYLDIITGLNDLLDAKTKYLTSYFSLLQSLAQYGYYEGTLYETVSTQK